MARLALKPMSYARFFYVATSRADDAGRYEFILPYSNESFSSVVEPGESYQIGIGKVRANLRVPEAAVLEGRQVAGPNFARGGG